MAGEPGTSREWANALAQAKGAATLPAEKEMVRLLALPILATDRAGIVKRVNDLRKLVADAPIGDLKQIEKKLSDGKSGLGRLYKLELSTALRNDLLTSMRSRIGRNDAGVNPNGRGVPDNRVGTTVTPPKAPPAGPNISVPVGPIEIGPPLPDGNGRHVIVISGTVKDKTGAMKVIADHLSKELKKTNPSASVEALQLPDSNGQIQPTIRVSNVGGYELWLGLAAVQGSYRQDLAANSISEDRYNDMQAAKAWAGVFQKLGNIYNPVPLTEFTDQGFEFTGFNSPLDVLTFVKGVKDIRKLKGQGQINRRALGKLADAAADVNKVTALLKKGLNSAAWQKALNQLSTAEKALLQKLAQAEQEVLQAIKAGQKKKAYDLVKKWREPARKLYDKVRDNYWKDPAVRKEWGEAGADMSSNAPTFLVEHIEDGKKFYKNQTVTLEHKTRVNDNPFLAVSEKNIVKSFGYENSVILEDIRRIERGMDTVWASGPIELLVRTMELETK